MLGRRLYKHRNAWTAEGSQSAFTEPSKSLICWVSSVVAKRFCKPFVVISNLSPGTTFPPAPRVRRRRASGACHARLLRDHDAVRVLAHALDRLLREARGLHVGDEGLGIFGHRCRRAFRIA